MPDKIQQIKSLFQKKKENKSTQIFQYNASEITNSKINLYEVPQLIDYLLLYKPVVQEQKKRNIKEKLDLQQKSLINYKERLALDQLFFNYQDNPFNKAEKIFDQQNKASEKNIQKNQKQLIQQNLKQIGKTVPNNANPFDHQLLSPKQIIPSVKYENIIQSVNNRRKDPKQQFEILSQNYKDLKYKYDLYSTKIRESSKNQAEYQIFQKPKLQQNKKIKNNLEKSKQIQNQRKKLDIIQSNQPKRIIHQIDAGEARIQKIIQKATDPSMKFSQIIEIKEENFFFSKKLSKNKKFNLLKFVFDSEEKQLIGKSLLTRNYFNYSSIVNTISVVKIPIYRQISHLARRVSLKLSTGKQDISEFAQTSELAFKLNRLNFFDLMNVATARFTSQFVFKIVNIDIEVNVIQKDHSEVTSSQQQQRQIIYPENTTSASARYFDQEIEKVQIDEYLNVKDTQQQIQYQSLLSKYQKMFEQFCILKQQLISETIMDRYIHEEINIKMRRLMRQFINKGQKMTADVDRIVRYNKQYKNKYISIKLKQVLQAFDLKNKFQQSSRNLGIQKQINFQDYINEDEVMDQKLKKQKSALKNKNTFMNKDQQVTLKGYAQNKRKYNDKCSRLKSNHKQKQKIQATIPKRQINKKNELSISKQYQTPVKNKSNSRCESRSIQKSIGFSSRMQGSRRFDIQTSPYKTRKQSGLQRKSPLKAYDMNSSIVNSRSRAIKSSIRSIDKSPSSISRDGCRRPQTNHKQSIYIQQNQENRSLKRQLQKSFIPYKMSPLQPKQLIQYHNPVGFSSSACRKFSSFKRGSFSYKTGGSRTKVQENPMHTVSMFEYS